MNRNENTKMITVTLDDAIDRHELFGGMDHNLKNIEEKLGVDIIQRDSNLILKGDNAPQAEAIIREMINTLSRGEELDEQKVGYITDLSSRGVSYSRETEGGGLNRDIICFTHEGKPLRPKTIGQKGYVETIRRRDIVFGIGPAGTGKTYLAAARAVEALRTGESRRIVLVRPAVEAGENLGFLPGDLAEKINPYLRPLFDSLADMTQADLLRQFIEDSRVEIAPLAYMRGRTLNDAYIILDEAQNTTIAQMKMFLTRMGYNSRVVVCGDATQSDLSRSVRNGFVDAFERLRGVSEIGFMTLGREDIVRHALVQKIVDAYEKDFDESEYVGGRTRGERRSRVMSAADAFAESDVPERRQNGEESEETVGLDAPADEVSDAENSNASKEDVRDPRRGF